MQRKPGFPVTNCNIKMPDCSPNLPNPDNMLEDDHEQHQRRQQLINYGHSQWGFNNWSWSVTKQELDFIDFNNGKYCAGVVAFVSIKVKSFDIYRENIGYATSFAATKGFAIYKSRKCAVTNALRETLLSFGGSVAADLIDLLENKTESVLIGTESHSENNLNIANRAELKPSPVKPRKEGAPVARAQPMLAALPPRAPPPAPQPVPAPPVRPNSNQEVKPSEMASETEAARAERKRRQKLAQEEFRLKQMMKSNDQADQRQDVSKASSSFDRLLLNLPSQDILIEDTAPNGGDGKRKSPGPDSGAKRRNSFNKLNIVQHK
ncbi:DNA repair protein RAD52 homolog isoform X2 [Bombyx mori]|uniref:DNA repair protein RAD52-like protein n=1 Tax=Bombyx mori TaxID=7091 RepID=A0A8R2AJC7_BOMMO|nr:DNA repair protein RAD52 homolog isoform X2 [Bombyx mori]